MGCIVGGRGEDRVAQRTSGFVALLFLGVPERGGNKQAHPHTAIMAALYIRVVRLRGKSNLKQRKQDAPRGERKGHGGGLRREGQSCAEVDLDLLFSRVRIIYVLLLFPLFPLFFLFFLLFF
jgi:hypothetical protein